jgi:xanthine dehydrogenase YagT iron-sulfur-binding subunit
MGDKEKPRRGERARENGDGPSGPPAGSGERGGFSRRAFIRGTGIAGIAASAGVLIGDQILAANTGANSGIVGPGAVPITLHVNGQAHQLNLEPRVTLLDALRDRLDLTGAKKVCDRGTCGACTVIADGKAIYSCTTLAIDAEGRQIETIESLAPEGHLHPISQAFVDNDAQQCGFCTPGFVMACKAHLDHEPHPTEESARRALGGNLCRCGTYMGLRKAVLEAATKMKGGRA